MSKLFLRKASNFIQTEDPAKFSISGKTNDDAKDKEAAEKEREKAAKKERMKKVWDFSLKNE